MTAKSYVIGAALLAAISVSATPAQAQPLPRDWGSIAQCESGGNPATNTGNGFYGMYQIQQSTWVGAGGLQFAARADLATPAQQTIVADRIMATQGPGAWPVCSRR